MAIGDSHILYNSVPLYPDDISDPQHLVWNNGMAECWFFDGLLILTDCQLGYLAEPCLGEYCLLEWRQFLDCRNVNKGGVRE